MRLERAACEPCGRDHLVCPLCGAQTEYDARFKRPVEAHGPGGHYCIGTPAYMARVRELAREADAERELLTECRECGATVIRFAHSPVLYAPAWGRPVHNCAQQVAQRVTPEAAQVPQPKPGTVVPATGLGFVVPKVSHA